MINNQNFHYYLRCLVNIADKRPLSYEEIPKEFIDFFTLPGICQAINLCVRNKPELDYDKVENYFKDKSFSSFDELAEAIQNNFQSDYEKLYACFYFVAHHVEYDYERSLIEKRDPLSIQTIFNTRRGVCVEYAKFFRELAKKTGITSKIMRILPFENASKGAGWDSRYPPQNPDFKHEANYIEINNSIFLSEPTWAAGSSDDLNQFSFDYNKSYFLIPYYQGILDHFPKEILNESLTGHFTWDHFISINKPDITKELCFESNPFQKITVEDGFYEMQFSFIQPLESISGDLYLLKGNTWYEQDKQYVSYECLAKNLPSKNFSLSNESRCRYKLALSFPEKGEYRNRTYLNGKALFTTYFDVKSSTDKLLGIYGCGKEKYGFMPIIPKEGLTQITNGFARIRFAVKLSRSKILINMYNIKKGTLDRLSKIGENDFYNYFVTKLPFNYDSNDVDSNDYLVEDWVLINFPNDGRFEIELFFANGKSFIHGVTYYFDVTGTKKDNIIYPYFDLPNNRTFVPFKTKKPDEIWLEPSEQTIIKEGSDFYFHVFSEYKISVYFTDFYTQKPLFPQLISEKDTDNGNIKDREYSAPYLEKGYYILNIFDLNGEFLDSQNYFILGSKLHKESHDEKKLMKNLKDTLEGKIDCCKDIPNYIQQNVQKMVEKTIADYNLNNDEKGADPLVIIEESSELESEEEKTKLKKKIIDLERRASNLEIEKDELNKKVTELGKQKEEQEKHALSLEQEKDELNKKVTELGKLKEEQEKHANLLEQEKNEISNKLNELMEQKENLNNKSTENDKEETEMITKLKDLELKKQELENQAKNLAQQNDDLNNKFENLAKQKEEQEKRAQSLEQEKNDLNNKVNELEKQKEEIIENMEKEKSIADSKVQSFENKINELMKQKEEQENHANSLEKEKDEINSKLKDEDKNSQTSKDELISKLKELENQTDLLKQEKNSMNDKINELIKQKEEQENHAHSLELKNNEINKKLEELSKQKEDMNNQSFEQEKESNEMITKLKDLELKKQELENQANNLALEKDDLNKKFENLAKQKEEQEKRALSLEQEKNDLNNKVNELTKQKEEIIENMEKEKSIADSKVQSFENKINELMKQKEEQEKRAKNLELEKKDLSKKVIKYKRESLKQKDRTNSLEQEKNDLNNKVIELEKQKEEIISTRERSINLNKNMSNPNLKSKSKEPKLSNSKTTKSQIFIKNKNEIKNTQIPDSNETESSKSSHHKRKHRTSTHDRVYSPTKMPSIDSSSDEKKQEKTSEIGVELLKKSAADPSYLKVLSRVTSELELKDTSKYFEYTLSKFSEEPQIDQKTGVEILRKIRKLLKKDPFYEVFKSSSSFLLLPFGTFSEELFLIIRDLVLNHSDIFSHEDDKQVQKSLLKSFIDDPQKGLSVTITAAQNYNKDLSPLFESIQNESAFSVLRNDSTLFSRFLSLVVFMCQNIEEYREAHLFEWFSIISNFLNEEKSKKNLVRIYCTLCYLRDCCTTKYALKLPIETMTTHLSIECLQGKILALLAEADPYELLSEKLISILFETAEKCQNMKASLVLMKLADHSEKHATFVFGSGDWMLRGLPGYTETFQLFLIVFKYKNLKRIISKNKYFVKFMKKIVLKLASPGTIAICSTIVRRIGINKELIQAMSKKGFISVFIENAKMLDDDEKVSIHSLLLFIHAIGSIQFVDEFVDCLKLICDLLKNDRLLSGIASHVVVALVKYDVCKDFFIEQGLPEFFKNKINEKKDEKLITNGKIFLEKIGV